MQYAPNIHGSLGQPESTTETASRPVQPFFAQLTAECPYILYNVLLLPPSKLALPIRIWTSSNTWFLGPTRVINLNSISTGSAVFARLTTVTDRPTDHTTRSITTGRMYVRRTTLRPKKLQGQGCSQIVLQHVALISKYIVEEFIICIFHLFSYSRHIGGTISTGKKCEPKDVAILLPYGTAKC